MWCQQGTAQVYSGYLLQGFEGATFPPTDWQVQSVLGAAQWVRNTTDFHSGAASAYMVYQAAGGDDYLISPKFAAVATDKVTFWMKLDFQGYPPDELTVRVSTTTSDVAAFTNVILTLSEGVNYPPDGDFWYPFEASLAAYAGQEIYVAFRHTNTDGDGLYLDDIGIGTLPANDVTVVSIDNAGLIAAPGITPQVTVRNSGAAAQTFNVTVTSTDGYTATLPVTALAAGETQQVTFGNWLPATEGTYTLTATATLATDTNLSDNTLTKDFTVYPSFPAEGWLTKTAMPGGRWAHAGAAKANAAGTDASVYSITGNDGTFLATTANQSYTESAGTWATLAVTPAARQQIGAQVVGDKIYMPGGYAASFVPSNVFYIYDIPTNTWSTGPTLPTAVGDYAIGTYNDNFIYVIGGYNGTSDVNTVQVYDIFANTWTAGTSKSGTAVAGLRGGIANGKIIVAGGYSQTVGGTVNEAQIGTIDPLDPYSITWAALSPMPYGTTSRFAAGAMLDRVYFTGGDPTGAGTIALTNTFAYNVTTGAWELGPSKPTGVSNVHSFSPVMMNGRGYLVSTGGYNGSAVTTVNEWLDLGVLCSLTVSTDPVDQVATEGGNASFTVVSADATGFQWQVSNDNGVTWTNVTNGGTAPLYAGATTETLMLDGVVAANSGLSFRAVLSQGASCTLNSASADLTVTLATEGFTAAMVNVYPNPASSSVSITLPNMSYQNMNVAVYDVNGRTILQKSITGQTTVVDISALASGVYVFRISGDNSVVVKQVIKG